MTSLLRTPFKMHIAHRNGADGASPSTFNTLTVRLARLTLNAFLENVDLVVRTIEHFGEDAEKRTV